MPPGFALIFLIVLDKKGNILLYCTRLKPNTPEEKQMHRCLAVLTVLFLSSANASALSGSGAEADPWLITSLADFDIFAADPNYWDDHIRLENDIDLANRTYFHHRSECARA